MNNIMEQIEQSKSLDTSFVNNKDNLFKLIEASPAKFRLSREIPTELFDNPTQLVESIGDDIPLIFLDTETTGLNSHQDTIIEVGYVKVTYSPILRKFTSIICSKSFLNDPGFPLDAKIIEVTGLTDQDLKGHKVTFADIAPDFADNPILIAHNAKFDRPFIDKFFPQLADFEWGCSLTEIKWRDYGYSSIALTSLLEHKGFFYGAHRANIDCQAMLWLFLLEEDIFVELLKSINSVSYRLIAQGNTFAIKDALKAKGYRWNSDTKAWIYDFKAESYQEANEIQNNLEAEIDGLYHTNDQFSSRTRYK